METEKPNKKPVLSFLAMVLAVIVFAAIGAHLFKSRGASLVDVNAPQIQIDQWITSPPPDLNGRVYVLEFWATWCPPCIQSIPHMIELADKYKDKSVPFIALSVDRSSEPVKKTVKDRNINYYVGMDNGLSAKYSVRSIPSTFIIGQSGKVVWQGHPRQSDFEPALVNALNAPPPKPETNTK
ncbi:MAG: TlpA disulfide reductase family protein [Phycisphaerae bacterium]|nr:TlpA disulfide reductase family protein [Phycisphaerae bacterium]MDD5380155.1 TlpA disulfide reductase family protein [Phycisphaerae bacterium]